MIKVFAGYDFKESAGYHTFCHSVIQHCSVPVSITPVALHHLVAAWTRKNESDNPGATEFSFSRFLVPWLCDYTGWAIFMDGADMLVQEDLKKLWELRNENYAVQVVKHAKYDATPNKMWGQRNEWYPRKNWSSVMLINCRHPVNRQLTLKRVSEATGSYLHRFGWLHDNEIGPLPPRWNWLVGEQVSMDTPAVIHYTLGLPSIWSYVGEEEAANAWHQAHRDMNHVRIKHGNIGRHEAKDRPGTERG